MPKLQKYESARYPIPPLACDCHMHVFGRLDRYPPAATRSYTPRETPLAVWRDVAEALGLERVVVVQPSAYGSDNQCTVDSLRVLGVRARGIVQIDTAATDTELRYLHAAGVRGVRLNPKSLGLRDPAALHELIVEISARIAPLDWHIQLHTSLALVSDLANAIRNALVPVVLDHMGGARAGDDKAALRPLLNLLEAGQCWVKLSGAYRVSRQESGFSDTTPIARALVAANPDQLVWGTDWPHTAEHAATTSPDPPTIEFRSIHAAALLDLLAEAAGDEATFNRILVTNPTRLYGF
jgi:predicted TIM-barrel fold metal-dependent hydrolase